MGGEGVGEGGRRMGKKARVDAKGSWAGMNRGAGVEESEEALGAKGVRFEPRLGVVFQGRAFAVAAAAAAAAAAASAASAGAGQTAADVDVLEEDVEADDATNGAGGLEGLAMGGKGSKGKRPGGRGKVRPAGAVPPSAEAQRTTAQGALPAALAGAAGVERPGEPEELEVAFRMVFPSLALATVVHSAVSVDAELRPHIIRRESDVGEGEDGTPAITVSLRSTDPKFLKSAALSYIELLCLSASMATTFKLREARA